MSDPYILISSAKAVNDLAGRGVSGPRLRNRRTAHRDHVGIHRSRTSVREGRPPNAFQREPWKARGLRVDGARSVGVAAPRRPGDRIMHVSLRHGLERFIVGLRRPAQRASK